MRVPTIKGVRTAEGLTGSPEYLGVNCTSDTSCVTPARFLNFSEAQIPHPLNEGMGFDGA